MTTSTINKNVFSATISDSSSGGNPYDPTPFVGILDTYPNAKSAHSVARQLLSTYTGSCIKVRNDSAVELDIGFASNVLDEATLLTHCGAGDGFIVTVYDQSGTSFDLTAASDAAQPKIVSSGVVITGINSKPKLMFDGSDDILSSAYGSTLSNPTTTFTTWQTGVSAISVNTYYWGLYPTGGANPAPGLVNRGATVGAIYQAGPAFGPTTSIPTATSFITTMLSSTTGTNWIFRNDGNVVTNSGEDIGSTAPDLIAIAGNGNLASPVLTNWYESIVYEADKSADFVGIETNINDFYAVF